MLAREIVVELPKVIVAPPDNPVPVFTATAELTKLVFVTFPAPIVVTPVLLIVTSPDMATALAVLVELPSQKVPEAKVLFPAVTLP